MQLITIGSLDIVPGGRAEAAVGRTAASHMGPLYGDTSQFHSQSAAKSGQLKDPCNSERMLQPALHSRAAGVEANNYCRKDGCLAVGPTMATIQVSQPCLIGNMTSGAGGDWLGQSDVSDGDRLGAVWLLSLFCSLPR